MKFSSVLAVSAALSLLMVPEAGNAQSSRKCNLRGSPPPTKICDDGDGISYPCPPCHPRLGAGSSSNDSPLIVEQRRVKLEVFRKDLETYRQNAEAERAKDPGAPLDEYTKKIDTYRAGMEDYREGVSDLKSPN